VDIDAPTALLGGLSPARFMQRHWQRRPLVVRGAWPGVAAPLPRAALFELAARDDVESRLVVREGDGKGDGKVDGDGARWRVRHGPLSRRALPPLAQPHWTLLVQGLDLHVEAAHALLAPFRFVPAARLDDLMVSWASAGGGVGAHVDSYDVFLLQLEGRRRWRFGPARTTASRAFVPGLPLKILARFEPTDEVVLEPGDMLYLPPLWAHDGTADGGACMTASVGFRAPGARELARELLPRLVDSEDDDGAGSSGDRLYADPGQAALTAAGAVPSPLVEFARRAATQALAAPHALERALGEWLTEPKPQVWFEAGAASRSPRGRSALRLDRRTRMLHDARHVFINGESFRAGGRDAALLQLLADTRRLEAADVARFSAAARTLLDEWLAAGWLHEVGPEDAKGER
jgi:50S ribosomal protein L16 3-hydroxylase